MGEIKIYYQLVLTILALLAIVVSRIGIPIFMQSWRGKIKRFINQNNIPASREELQKSREQAELIEKREEELGFITKTVVMIEILVFSGLTILIFTEGSLTVLSKAKTFGAFLGVWLTIKVLSSHRPWSDVIIGKAYYHTSLIGTLLNVATGFIVGWLIYVAWFML